MRENERMNLLRIQAADVEESNCRVLIGAYVAFLLGPHRIGKQIEVRNEAQQGNASNLEAYQSHLSGALDCRIEF